MSDKLDMSNLIKFPKRTLKKNVVYCADNLEVMKQLPSESIDLIYIDPPFGKNATRKSRAWDNEVQGISFFTQKTKIFVSSMCNTKKSITKLYTLQRN